MIDCLPPPAWRTLNARRTGASDTSRQLVNDAKGGTRAMTTDFSTTDAKLLRLGVEMDERWEVEQRIAELDETPQTDADFRAARDRTGVIVKQIAQLEPQSLAGLRVLAKACRWLDEDDYDAKGAQDYEQELRQKVVAGVINLVA
jgi:hypothetical protein